MKINRSVTWEGMTGGIQTRPRNRKNGLGPLGGRKILHPVPERKNAGQAPPRGRSLSREKRSGLEKYWKRSASPRLMVEPGRAIVGDAGITLARVVEVYPVAGGHPLVTLDLGIVNHGTGLVEPDLYTWTLANDLERKDRRPFGPSWPAASASPGTCFPVTWSLFPENPSVATSPSSKKPAPTLPPFSPPGPTGFLCRPGAGNCGRENGPVELKVVNCP